MLRVTTLHANAAGASARYYTRYLADDGPDDPGLWLGRQAAGLGLDGEVTSEDLEAVLSGHDPNTGTRLGNPLHDRIDGKGRIIPAVAGFDATFSAPKSVSVWWGLTGDHGLLEAHDTAVRAVLGHLEHCGATTRVRVNGARQHPDAAGLTMAAFPQSTSREDDPQLHTHVVISAKVQIPDGRWLALDARYLKRKQRVLGGLYQSVLRAELSHRYGITWGPIDNGQAEIAGVADDLLATFSKRTAQVEESVAERIGDFRHEHGRDPSRWERAAITREAARGTRADKTHASLDDLTARWAAEAEAIGWTPASLVAAMDTAARDPLPTPEPVTVADVIEQLSTNGSTWTRADVIGAICDLLPPASQVSGHDWASMIEASADQVIDACLTLDPPHPSSAVRASDGRSVWHAASEPHLTHETVLAQEERIVVFATEANEECPSPSTTIDAEGLDVLQAAAAASVAGADGLVVVVGPAGTGKTTTLQAAAADLAAQHRTVFGVAPTAKAAKVLHDETGIDTETVAKLLYEWQTHDPKPRYRLPAGTTLIVDEAGMLGTGNLAALVDLSVSQDWRLVLVGDPRQLQAVGRGGMFDELCRTSRTLELATIHRFRHQWEQTASLDLRSGKHNALDAYFNHGRVHADTFNTIACRAADRWITANDTGRTVAVVAETNGHVDALNHAIQQARREAGQLRAGTTPVARGQAVHVGDHIVTRRNDRTVRTTTGEPVRNRDRWTVEHIRRDGALTVSHQQGHGLVTLPADYVHSNVELGYAATAHGNQGDTVDIGLAVITPATSHRSLYVGATRGRQENQLLVVTDQPDHAHAILQGVLHNDRADTPAISRRRELAREVPHPAQPVQDPVDAAFDAYDIAMLAVAPYEDRVVSARADLDRARSALRHLERQVEDGGLLTKRRLRDPIRVATADLTEADQAHRVAVEEARPFLDEVDRTADDFRLATDKATRAQRESRHVAVAATELSTEPPGLSLGL